MAQEPSAIRDPDAADRAAYQAKVQQILSNRAAYVAGLVAKWEDDARASGRWDPQYATELQGALMRLQLDNLVAAGDATSYTAFLNVIATGKSSSITTLELGDLGDDLVFTPVTPCRIVDTRLAGGRIAAGSARTFDVDANASPWYTLQGGVNHTCNIPFGVPRAVAMTITGTGSLAAGYLSAYGLVAPAQATSVLNYQAGWDIANTTIVPVSPGGGNDFTIFSSAPSYVVIDVLGYFAAPEATPLDCTTSSQTTAIPSDASWHLIDATCTVGRTVTGGGYDLSTTPVNVWITNLPIGNTIWRTWVFNTSGASRSVTSYGRCCRVPGR